MRARTKRAVFVGAVLAVLFLLYATRSPTGGGEDAAARVPPPPADGAAPEITHRVYFDIDIDGSPAGRVVMGLYGKHVPRTAENFRVLCTGERDRKELQYRGSPFHRVIPGFMSQGGDTTRGDGTGGASIYGKEYADESFAVKHTRAGLLSMANRGRDTNGSQFFITAKATPWLDGKHVVFGEVVEGQAVMDAVQALGSSSGRTSKRIVIAGSGELKQTHE
eukprot:m51a1_g11893 putative peptidyl-prolyl isomerase (221) ;mRNA; f:600863-601525